VAEGDEVHVSIEEVHMDGRTRVNLLGTIRVIHEHLTAALCEIAWSKERTTERRRIWTLQTMALFWTAVILRAPESLRQALDEAFSGVGGYPLARSSHQGFFKRAKGLKWQFFRRLLEDFTASVLRDHEPTFESALRPKLAAFTGVWIVDGSRLDQIAHRLKVTWTTRSAVLPGSVLALYDLFRGVARHVEFSEDGAAAEVPALRGVLDRIPPGTLLLADRAYCSHHLFHELLAGGIHVLTRCTAAISVEKLQRLSQTKDAKGSVEEWLVLVGTPQKPAERQRVRMIVRRRPGKKAVRLLTTVLDPEMLPATTALTLYRKRWAVERLFYDLKEVIDLHSFYAGNANAVAMQVYTAALVHTAMRVAQAGIAKEVRLEPEELSVEKLFPRIAAASSAYVTSQQAFIAIQQLNRGFELREPDWSEQEYASAPLASLRVEVRTTKRRKRRPSDGRYLSLHRFVHRRVARKVDGADAGVAPTGGGQAVAASRSPVSARR
jgi:hypothetical protein